ncbi:hypothetical protein ACGFI9_28370 [Micromonospora sp. NPDC048930]|uniref:hypothetical protein n=1 Tax=Micromonospora sp. NPDC048930 TaxID=3364261 RepID=UPI00371E9F12
MVRFRGAAATADRTVHPGTRGAGRVGSLAAARIGVRRARGGSSRVDHRVIGAGRCGRGPRRGHRAPAGPGLGRPPAAAGHRADARLGTLGEGPPAGARDRADARFRTVRKGPPAGAGDRVGAGVGGTGHAATPGARDGPERRVGPARAVGSVPTARARRNRAARPARWHVRAGLKADTGGLPGPGGAAPGRVGRGAGGRHRATTGTGGTGRRRHPTGLAGGAAGPAAARRDRGKLTGARFPAAARRLGGLAPGAGRTGPGAVDRATPAGGRVGAVGAYRGRGRAGSRTTARRSIRPGPAGGRRHGTGTRPAGRFGSGLAAAGGRQASRCRRRPAGTRTRLVAVRAELAPLLLRRPQVVDPAELLADGRLVRLGVGPAAAPPATLGTPVAPLLGVVLGPLRTTRHHC